MPKASVAVGMIAKNAAKTIGACLDSIVPYVEQVVVCVDCDTTDDTAAVAAKHGAKVYMGLTVSEDHTCEAHGTVKAQHFAKARQISFDKLRRDVAFHMWIDADDIVKNADRLADYLARLAPDCAGVWMPYHYATAGQGGPTTTLFDRERIVRTSMPWEWKYRVHEIIVPQEGITEHLNWARTEEISIWHQGEGHDTQGSARRNILLLEIDLEEDPEDMRAWFYLGNQYFALGEWGNAAHCFEKAGSADNPYQLWQTLIYLSMAYEKLQDLDNSRLAAFRALDVQPSHPEPYYRLAAIYMLMGDLERTEYWTKVGDGLPPPPQFVFKNPMDKPFNARLTLAQAYIMRGHTSKALRQLKIAAQTLPSEQVMSQIAYTQQIEEDTKTAEAWVRVLSELAANRPTNELQWWNAVVGAKASVWKFGRVRDIVVPHMLKIQSQAQPRIVFWCGHSLEPWAPPSLNTTGIGGSETAVVQIAKRFAADGWRVDVYNDCDKYEGVYEGVGYWDCKRLQEHESTDVLVSWRNPDAFDLPIERKVSLLWCHDLNRGPSGPNVYSRWSVVLGVSNWHADYLSQLYQLQRTDTVPNGIDLDRFTNLVPKVSFRCVYASSPDRGLPNLLRMWREIVAQEPTAELHVAYGWENIDKSIVNGFDKRGQLTQLKEQVTRLIEKTPGVVWRGRLPQDELAKLYQESYCWLYPTSFVEVSCISAMEAMAGGCVPVTSAAGALPETIGEGGLIVPGNTYTQAWKEFWVQCAKAVLLAPDQRIPRATAGMERAKQFTWDNAYSKWQEIITPLLERKKEEVLA